MKDLRDEKHWIEADYRQRMLKKDWDYLLMNDLDRLIFKGKMTELRSNRLTNGVVKVYKVI